MPKATTLAVLALLLLAPAALASVGGVSPQPNHPFEAGAAQPDAEVTRSITVVIAKIGPDNTFELFDPKTEKTTVVKLSDQVPLRAKSKKLFDGRKQLQLADLAPGQKVRLSYRANDGVILGLTVLQRA